MKALFDNPVLDEEKEEVIVKKIIGAMVMFIGCAMAAVDLGRMIIGLAYAWDSILGGFVISVLSWVFLLDSKHGLLLDAAKSAVCVAAIICFSLFTNAGNRTDPIAATDSTESALHTSKYTYTYYQDNEPVDHMICSWCHGSGVCKQCNGSGRNDLAGVLAAYGCTLCDKTGRCVQCGGNGYVGIY